MCSALRFCFSEYLDLSPRGMSVLLLKGAKLAANPVPRPGQSTQYTTTNPPETATALGSDHTASPSRLPAAPSTGLSPSPAKTCHPTDPPRFHPVPSAHASSTCPSAPTATEGCFCPPEPPPTPTASPD